MNQWSQCRYCITLFCHTLGNIIDSNRFVIFLISYKSKEVILLNSKVYRVVFGLSVSLCVVVAWVAVKLSVACENKVRECWLDIHVRWGLVIKLHSLVHWVFGCHTWTLVNRLISASHYLQLSLWLHDKITRQVLCTEQYWLVHVCTSTNHHRTGQESDVNGRTLSLITVTFTMIISVLFLKVILSW